MHKFWSWLGLNLGKHWIAVLLVGGVITLGLGYGTTKLEFSTDQSNYLNRSDQVYKDNVAYQKLFGGEAMITLVTMDPGHTVAELFSPADIAQWNAVAKKINASPNVLGVVSPLTALQWNDNLVTGPNGDVTQSVAGKILADDLAREKSKAGQAARNVSALATISRINAIPVAQRTLANPQVRRLPALRQSASEGSEAHPHPAPSHLSRQPARADGRATRRQPVHQG